MRSTTPAAGGALCAIGDIRLPVGYIATAEIDAATYLADHPEDAAG